MPHRSRPILLVEDNPMDVDLTLRAFGRSSCNNPMICARDGQEALDLIPRWEQGEPVPILILLDLNLPKVNGLEVLQQIRSHQHFCSLPVVVLTTSSEDQDILAAYRLGANSYVVKPVDFEKFVDVAAKIYFYWVLLNTSPLTN